MSRYTRYFYIKSCADKDTILQSVNNWVPENVAPSLEYYGILCKETGVGECLRGEYKEQFLETPTYQSVIDDMNESVAKDNLKKIADIRASLIQGINVVTFTNDPQPVPFHHLRCNLNELEQRLTLKDAEQFDPEKGHEWYPE